jgi:hypothetical protein
MMTRHWRKKIDHNVVKATAADATLAGAENAIDQMVRLPMKFCTA